MTKSTGRVSAVVLGLISGIIHGIVGSIIALAILLGGSLLGSFGGSFGGYFYGATTILGLIVFVIALLNLIGGCIVRRSRITGGVFMMITSIPIISLSFSASMLSFYYGVGFTWFFTLTGLLSFTAAILAFIPYSQRYRELYAQRKMQKHATQQQRYQQPYPPQQPYQQPYPPQQPYQQPYPPQQPYQQQPPVTPQPQQPPVAAPPKDTSDQ